MLVAVPALASAPESKPAHIVSINLCADDALLRIAEPRNIAAVTWLSRDPYVSSVSALARAVPIHHGSREEIVLSRPDVVIASTFNSRPMVSFLRHANIPVVELPIPNSVAEVRTQIRDVAKLVGEEARGETIVTEMDRRLAAIPPATTQLRAVVLNPDGFPVGAGTLMDDAMRHAGLINVAAQLKFAKYDQVPLELVVANAVDLMVVSSSRDGPPALITDVLRHPVLAGQARHTRVVVIPSRFFTCGGPTVVELIERLRDAAQPRAGSQP